MSTRAQLRAEVRANLADANITYYDDDTINQSLQDAYNEIAAKCRCIINTATVNQVARNPYYDFVALGVSDYLGTIAIFNLQTNWWLRDDVSIRDFDRLRRDWETWVGAPQFWAPHSQKRIAICPNLFAVANAQFTLRYWANAPTFVLDTDVPLVASDQQNLLEFYATADCLENAQEITKAAEYWQKFENGKVEYRTRCQRIAKQDLLLRV